MLLITKPLETKEALRLTIPARLVIATFFSFSFAHLTRSIELAFSPSTSIWFVLLSLSQFHVPYYAGRTLPNFLALPPGTSLASCTFFLPILVQLINSVLYSVSLLLRGLRNHDKRSLNRSIALLTLAATVVRLEIAPMPVVLSMALVILQRLTFLQALQAGATGGFAGLGMFSIHGRCLQTGLPLAKPSAVPVLTASPLIHNRPLLPSSNLPLVQVLARTLSL